MGSESEKELFNQFTMYVFPELMRVFAYTFYARNFGEVEGAYWFGPVRPSVCLSVIVGSLETREPLMLES